MADFVAMCRRRAADVEAVLDNEGPNIALYEEMQAWEALAEHLETVDSSLAAANQAGRELATALWALVLAQETRMSMSRPSVIEHAEAVVKKYTSEADREQLSAALERARSMGGEWAP